MLKEMIKSRENKHLNPGRQGPLLPKSREKNIFSEQRLLFPPLVLTLTVSGAVSFIFIPGLVFVQIVGTVGAQAMGKKRQMSCPPQK